MTLAHEKKITTTIDAIYDMDRRRRTTPRRRTFSGSSPSRSRGRAKQCCIVQQWVRGNREGTSLKRRSRLSHSQEFVKPNVQAVDPGHDPAIKTTFCDPGHCLVRIRWRVDMRDDE